MMFLGIGTLIGNMLRNIGMWIIQLIYTLIASLYNIFIYLTKVQILTGSNESIVKDIYNRIQVILAVVMVFYVTLEFVKYIVNPDTFSDKEKGGGGLVKRILIVIVLMAFTPQIFGIAYDLQNRIISSEVIPKVLIKNYNPANYGNKAGGNFSSTLLNMFYNEKTYNGSSLQCKKGVCVCDDIDITAAQAISSNLSKLKNEGTIDGSLCIEDATDKDNGTLKKGTHLIEVNWLLAIGVGCFIAWMLFMYCMEAGRVIIQFMFLQIIAPIPVLSYIAPGKDGMFQKWTRQCVTTYLDMFIRLFIMYLVLMVADILLGFLSNRNVELFTGYNSLSDGTKLWIIIFLIIGLFLFAMKAPKMVKELLPGGGNAASGDFGIGAKSAKERFKPFAKPLGAGLGVARGAGRGLASAYRQHKINKANGQTALDKFKRNVYDPSADKGERWLRRHNENKANRQAIKNEKNRVRAASNSVRDAKRDLNEAKKSEVGKAHETAREATRKLGESHKRVKNLEAERTALLNGRDASRLSSVERQNLQSLDKQLLTAKNDYSNDLRNAQNANKASLQMKQNSPAWQNFASAQQKLQQAQQSGNASEIQKAQKNLQQAAKGVENGDKLSAFFAARDEYEQLKASGASQANIDAAKQKMDGALKNVGNDAKLTATEKAQKNLETAKSELESANEVVSNMESQYKEQVAKENHDQYRSAVVAGVTSGVTGIVKETVKGLKTKEITDVWKDHTKAQGEIVQELEQKQAYYDAGGPVGIGATVQRTVEHVRKDLGFGTTYEQIQSQIKPIESQIKQEKAYSTVQESISSSLSDTKKSVEGAKNKHKLQNNVSSLNGQQVDGGTITVQAGETADSVITRYMGEVEEAKKARDVSNERKAKATTALNEKRNEVDRIQRELVVETDAQKKAKLTNDLANEKISLKNLEDEYNLATNAAESDGKKFDAAERLYGNVEKAIIDLTMQQALQAYSKGKSIDDVVATGIKEEEVGNAVAQLIANLEKAKSEPNIVSRLKGALDKRLFEVFMLPNYSTANISDIKKIDDAIKRIIAESKAKTSRLEEQVRQAQVKAEEAKLVSESGSSGGKK